MYVSTHTVEVSLVLLLLVAQLQITPCWRALGADAADNGSHIGAEERQLPLSMQARWTTWKKRMKKMPHFLTEMPRWEDEQHEQHPLDSPALRGPFEYSEEEQRALEGNLAVDDGEWNAKSGGIGGRPRPRYCVLDKAWRASEASDVDFSPAGFRTSLKRALLDGRLYDFLVNDRYQEPKGHDVLTGEPLAMDLVSSYSCPSLRTYAEADWTCAIKTQGGQRNGLIKMDKAFKDVRTMRLTSSSLLEPLGEIPNFDNFFFQRGPSFPHCREGSCDCDMVFDHLDGHFPAVCNVKNLLMALEPYRETYARRQITVTFSLYDKPWFTASNESIFDYKGRIPLESVLPTRYASIPVRTAMQSGRPCCIAGSGLAAGWSRAIGLGGYSTKASEIACQGLTRIPRCSQRRTWRAASSCSRRRC